jgi:hypothetical protein
MKKVFESFTLLEAEMACVRLRRVGLEPRLEGDGVGIRGPATPISVWVADGDARKAERALAPKTPRRAGARAKPAPRKKKVSRR